VPVDNNCSFGLHEETNTSQDPVKVCVRLLGLHLQVGRENIRGTSCSGRVHRTIVEADLDHLCLFDGRDVHHWQLWVKLLRDHIHQVTLILTAAQLPFGTLQEESMNVSSVFSSLLNVFWLFNIQYGRTQNHVIKGKTLVSCSDLHNGSQV